MNAEFQRITRRDKKAFLSNQCKEIEENNRMGKTRDLFKKIRDTKGTFLEKEMATHFSILVWRIPGTGEPGGLPSMGSHRVGQLKQFSSSSSRFLMGGMTCCAINWVLL